MPQPTTSRMSRASNVSGRSVVSACARIATVASSPRRRAKSGVHTTAAAAPQVGGHAIRRVITPGQIAGDASTSSSVTTVRNSASGLFAACRLALARIFAKVESFVPYCFMCARPAPPKYFSANGTPSACTSSSVAASKRSNGLGRSGNASPSAPGFICSKPTASAQSTAPLATACAREEQRGRAGRAVVVDVDHRHAAHAHVVGRALAAARIAVDEAGVDLPDVRVAEAARRRARRGSPARPSSGRRRSRRAWRTGSSRRRPRARPGSSIRPHRRGSGFSPTLFPSCAATPYFHPYMPVNVALPRRLALIMKPTSAAVPSAGTSSFSTLSACTVKM